MVWVNQAVKLLFFSWMGLGSFTASGQSGNLERVAYDYFLMQIAPTEYQDGVILVGKGFTFKGTTEKKFTTFGLNDNCFQKDDYMFKLKLDSNAIKAGKRSYDELTISTSEKSNLMKRFSKTKLWIYKATEMNGLFYVKLEFWVKNEGQNSFFFELSKSGEVLRYCTASLIY